jgi:hypothetical protein
MKENLHTNMHVYVYLRMCLIGMKAFHEVRIHIHAFKHTHERMLTYIHYMRLHNERSRMWTTLA